MKIDFKSYNPIIICFPRYAGGKFISNCLALSKHAVPQDCKIAKNLLLTASDYQYRFDSIIKSLPPSRSDMKEWINKYEFGDRQLYGEVIDQWRNGIVSTEKMNTVVTDLSTSNLRYFICCHDGADSVKKLLRVWPNAQILVLINHVQFSTISWQLKSIKELN